MQFGFKLAPNRRNYCAIDMFDVECVTPKRRSNVWCISPVAVSKDTIESPPPGQPTSLDSRDSDESEVERLRVENAELRATIKRLECRLHDMEAERNTNDDNQEQNHDGADVPTTSEIDTEMATLQQQIDETSKTQHAAQDNCGQGQRQAKEPKDEELVQQLVSALGENDVKTRAALGARFSKYLKEHPDEDAKYKQISGSDVVNRKRAFRLEWASALLEKKSAVYSTTNSFTITDVSLGKYEPYDRILWFEGGGRDTESAKRASTNYMRNAFRMGGDMLRWNPMTERTDIYYVKVGRREELTRMWSKYTECRLELRFANTRSLSVVLAVSFVIYASGFERCLDKPATKCFFMCMCVYALIGPRPAAAGEDDSAAAAAGSSGGLDGAGKGIRRPPKRASVGDDADPKKPKPATSDGTSTHNYKGLLAKALATKKNTRRRLAPSQR